MTIFADSWWFWLLLALVSFLSSGLYSIFWSKENDSDTRKVFFEIGIPGFGSLSLGMFLATMLVGLVNYAIRG